MDGFRGGRPRGGGGYDGRFGGTGGDMVVGDINPVKQVIGMVSPVITSYSIHYTKLYDANEENREGVIRKLSMIVRGYHPDYLFHSYNFV